MLPVAIEVYVWGVGDTVCVVCVRYAGYIRAGTDVAMGVVDAAGIGRVVGKAGEIRTAF